MSVAPIRGTRYERKFFLAGIEEAHVKDLVFHHPAMFYEPYPARFVNNIYLDTPWMDNYQDNLIGSTERQKVRVRWYHDLFRWVEDPLLEFKLKSGVVGWKEQYDFPAFQFDRGFSPRVFSRWIVESDLSARVKHRLLAYQPSLVNQYRRSYFATRNGHFRATVDTGMTYYKVNRLENRFMVRHVDHGAVIVELKYDREYERDADRIASSLPFRLSRSSKYVQGIEVFYGW